MYLALLLALTLDPTAAVEPVPSFFSRTCTRWNATDYCASVNATVDYDPGLFASGRTTKDSSFALFAALSPWGAPSPLYLTAFSFYVPYPVTPLDAFIGLSGWTGGTFPAPPEGYHLLAGLAVEDNHPERWYFAGVGFSGDINGWTWGRPTFPEGLRWAWRAESEDGGTVLECYQDRGEDCLTLTPEPATWALLLTGLLGLGLMAKRRGQTGSGTAEIN